MVNVNQNGSDPSETDEDFEDKNPAVPSEHIDLHVALEELGFTPEEIIEGANKWSK